jgi:3alpha(or 20beta)-hydroxysteroid dehydrogenase
MAFPDLEGQVIVITGAAGGIGTAVARRLRHEGARLVVVDLDRATAEGLAADLGGGALGVGADVSTADGVEAYMSAAVERFGRIDAYHLNAGYPGRLVPFAESEISDFDRVMAVNVRGVYLGLRAALRQIGGQGGGGAIVVTASTGALGGAQLWGPYIASKHAVLGLVRTVALETARDGIRVNAVCPGFTDTAMVRPTEDAVDAGDRGAARAVLENALPMGRYAEPAEMAATVAWLLSREASYVTGASFAIDGGMTAGCAGYVPPAPDGAAA